MKCLKRDLDKNIKYERHDIERGERSIDGDRNSEIKKINIE